MMKPQRQRRVLATTAAISAIALFSALAGNLNAGQSGYGDYRYYDYERRYQPPAPPRFMYGPPHGPYMAPGYGYKKGYPAHNSYRTGYPPQSSSQASYASQDSDTDRNSVAANGKKVAINGMRFEPATIRVKAGEQVTWINNAAMPHTVTGRNDGSLSSEQMGRGSMFSHSFNEPGTYEYYCALHPNMTGTVVVD